MKADALHCPNCGVKRRDDRAAFFAYYQITDQIKAVNVSCARLVEHRSVAVESNAERVHTSYQREGVPSVMMAADILSAC